MVDSTKDSPEKAEQALANNGKPEITSERKLETLEARQLAKRYQLEFVDMDEFHIDQELFRSIPADLMFRYSFVPLRREGQTLVIVVSDPSDLQMTDELATVLNTPVRVTAGTPSAIQSILKKSENSQRVLEDATVRLQAQVLENNEDDYESLTVENLTNNESPIIRLVNSAIFFGNSNGKKCELSFRYIVFI